MDRQQIINEQPIAARFEFRTFGQDLQKAAYRMARLSEPVPESLWERSSDEIYILSRANDINNSKIRDGKMDIKTFVQTMEGLEQWSPLLKCQFPIEGQVLKTKVFPAFGSADKGFFRELYSLEDFLELVGHHSELQVVNVHKQRFAYKVNNTICETGRILINGACVYTISSESTEIEDILKTIEDLGLKGIENINYLQAIKRVTGMINKRLAN